MNRAEFGQGMVSKGYNDNEVLTTKRSLRIVGKTPATD